MLCKLPVIKTIMRNDDLLMIVGDHGVDPTTPSTDHSREYVPLLVFGDMVRSGVDLGIRSSFGDVGATVAEIFDLVPPVIGTSFLSDFQSTN